MGEVTDAGEELVFLSPTADRGRGGAMLPKRRDASSAAPLPPPGLSSSDSSSSSSSFASEPHPSSVSARLREIGPEIVGTVAAPAAATGLAVMR